MDLHGFGAEIGYYEECVYTYCLLQCGCDSVAGG